MARNKATVYYAKSLNDAVFHMKTVPQLKIFGGCTTVQSLPPASLMIKNIADFSQITKHEHYIEFGAGVTLSQILELGEKRLPPLLYEAINTIGTPLIRNIATIGGNICAEGIRHTLFAPLLALEAQLEIHSATETVFMPVTQFTEIENNKCLTRVKIPSGEWEISVFRRTDTGNKIMDDSASYCFLANTQKGILTDVRIAFSGIISIRSRELENNIIGTKLPLTEKAIQTMLIEAQQIYETQADFFKNDINPLLEAQFLNLLNDSLLLLT